MSALVISSWLDEHWQTIDLNSIAKLPSGSIGLITFIGGVRVLSLAKQVLQGVRQQNELSRKTTGYEGDSCCCEITM